MWVVHTLKKQKHLYEHNKHAFDKSNIYFFASVIMSVKFANSGKHLIQTIRRMHYSKAIIRTIVALQEVSVLWLTQSLTFMCKKVSEYGQKFHYGLT